MRTWDKLKASGTAKIPEGYIPYRCPVEGCFYGHLHKVGESTDHSCPHLNGKTVHNVSKEPITYDIASSVKKENGASVNQQLFERLDAEMENLMNPATAEHEKEYIKAYMRGVAFALARMMQPLFKDEKEVSREVAKRYKARKAGEQYETPCVGSRWKENPVTMRYVHVLGMPLDKAEELNPTAKPKSAIQVKAEKLDPAKRKMIKESPFPDADLAKMFGISTGVVRYIKENN